MSRLLKFLVTAYAPLVLHYRLLDAHVGRLDGVRADAFRSRARDAQLRPRAARPPSMARSLPTSLAA
jgi:hypothetical protein